MRRLSLVCLVVLLVSFSGLAVSADEPQFAFRALWTIKSEFSTPEAADRLLDDCRRAKINTILACVMQHGGLLHKSSHFLHRSIQEGDFDPLENLVQKAHAQGIQVHAWYCVYYEGVKGLSPGNPDWLCSDIEGVRMSDTYFLSPQIPGVNDYLLSVMEDGLAYDIDGVHLDYIRYYGTGYDYSDLGRAPFIESHGFDPKDFLDHADRIVPLDQDPFPVRALRSESSRTRPWEVTWMENLLDRAQIGFGQISESTANIESLPVPGALILNCYYNIPGDMATSIESYVKRGGTVLCINRAFTEDERALAELFGIQPGHTSLPKAWRIMKTEGTHPLTACIPKARFSSSAAPPADVDGGTIVARFDSGEPAVVANSIGDGRTVFVAFNPGDTCTEPLAEMVSGIIEWLRTESGVEGIEAPLVAKRAEWIQWRNDAITSLVRDVHEAARVKGPNIQVSIAGGCNDLEHYRIFRDGRRWIEEGLLDFDCPMDYFDDVDSLRHALDEHEKATPEDFVKSVYPGLGLYTRKTVDGKKVTVSQDPEILKAQLGLLRENGYRGFAVFSSLQMTEEQIPVLAEAAR